ncbi:Transmembrane 9 super member 3 [Maudiozyma exigua]|uniref:Transmembrane 9 super member 3 n=1 Tax=Maudiozyma exigua TaxID=34358 RepID=A0A9P6W0Y8_MAUEX|nr:Transmembrane 9 super member 3 [Kazachstania exigua]
MSNYSNCRDSYVQYQHLSQSHNILYHEWIDDGILPTPDQIISNQETNDDKYNDHGPMITNLQVSDKYWDYFCDDEQWEIFNPMNLSIESNGNIIFNKLVSAQGPLDNIIDTSNNNNRRDRDNNRNNNTIATNSQGHMSGNASDNDDDDTNGIIGDSDNLTDNNNSSIQNNNNNNNNNTRINKDNSDNDIIVGSAFDLRTLNSIKQVVNGWSSGYPDFHTR